MPFEVLRCYIAIIGCSILTLFATIAIIKDDWFVKFEINIVKNRKKFALFVMISGVVGYLLTVMGYFGVTKYVKDFDVFLMWSNMMNDDGFKGFMVEYPAGSLYLFTLLRYILRLVGVADNYIITVLFMKFPAIFATMAIAYLAYKWSLQKYDDAKPIFIMMFIVYNPVSLVNASLWGQIDMILVLIVVATLYFLKKEKYIVSILLYTLGCLTKAQMIFFAPIFGMFIIMPLFKKATRKKALKQIGIGVLLSVVGFSLLTLPFKNNITDMWLVEFFKHISTEHPVNTASALNLFGLHGGSFQPDTNRFLFMNYRIWGYIFIALTCIFCAYLVIKDYKNRRVFLLSAFCMASVFTLGVSMHERYIVPLVALVVISYIFSNDC
jgi:Gpi18-like mannosyltransferase